MTGRGLQIGRGPAAALACLLVSSGAAHGEAPPPAVVLPSAPAAASTRLAPQGAAAPPASARATAAPGADASGPSLAEAQAAAARVAAGSAAEDDSRLSRARAAHWAPQLRAQVQGNTSDRARAGEQYQAPVRWDEQGAARGWLVSATWDLAQLVYDRDENQLALSRTHLARRRQEAAEEAGRLYAERLRCLRALREARGAARLDAVLELLRVTAALDALTGGLFREPLARAQALIDQLAAARAPEEER